MIVDHQVVASAEVAWWAELLVTYCLCSGVLVAIWLIKTLADIIDGW